LYRQSNRRWHRLVVEELAGSRRLGGPVTVPAGESIRWALGIMLVLAPLAVRAYRRKT
jgi:hypothetical protein